MRTAVVWRLSSVRNIAVGSALCVLLVPGRAWAQGHEVWLVPPSQPPPPYAPPPPPPPPAATPVATSDESDKDKEKDKEKEKADPDEDRWVEKNCIMGFRFSGLNVQGSDHDQQTFGTMLWTWSEKYSTPGHVFTNWGSFLGGIGGGTGGLEGALGGGIASGLRAPFTKHQGPLFRVGFDGQLVGNDAFYGSYLQVPRFMVGYQYLEDTTVVELGGMGGATVTGRYNLGDNGHRKVDGLDYGAYAALHLEFGRVDVTWIRVLDKNEAPGTPVDMVKGEACVYVDPFGICADGWFMRGDVQYGTTPPIESKLGTTTYFGIHFGWKDL